MRTVLLALLLAALPMAPLAQEAAASAPGSAPGAAEPEALGIEWPRAIELGKGSLEIYQPQLETFEGVNLTGRSALAYAEKDKAPVFGVMWFTARVSVDRDARTAHVDAIQVRKVRFPNAQKDQEKKVAAAIEAAVPTWDLTVGLEAIQANLAVNQREVKSSQGLSSKPPRMIFAEEPTVLLLYEGTPVERDAGEGGLRRVVNTPMFVVGDPASRQYWLAGGRFWYRAPAAIGPWTSVDGPPAAVRRLHDAHPPPSAAEGGAAEPDASEKRYAEPSSPPKIAVSTEPAELFVFDGPPKFQTVGEDAALLYAENTERFVFVDMAEGSTYVVVGGRWFKASSLKGPWTAVRPDRLPAAFARLPPDSSVGEARTFVAGTEEAQDAVADAQIPQTAAVKRDQTIEVVYDGEPRFKAIEGTSMAFAVNTSSSVIRDAGRYWCCHQGVWYVAGNPRGPWTVSDRRPPDIDQVPPSAPVYNTRYVYVYQSTPQVVYTGYLPGYVGMYPYYGTVVYGTGFWYPPYVGAVAYYPRPVTYGFDVVYNPWVGFGFAFTWGTPFVMAGWRWGPPPGYPPYWRPPYWGPAGYRPYPPPYPGGWYRPPPGYRPPYPGYRPPPPGWGHGRPAPPPGYRPGPGPAPAPPRPPQGNLYARPENRARNADASHAIAARPAPRPVNKPNNVYADRQGNIYRQTGNSWEKNTPQGWKPQPTQPAARPGGAPPPSTRPAQPPGASTRPAAPPSASRPSTSPGYPPAPSARPYAGAPTPRPSQPAARPSAPSYPSAPAGLGRDAAARQRASAPSYRAPPSGGGHGGGHGGGGGRGR